MGWGLEGNSALLPPRTLTQPPFRVGVAPAEPAGCGADPRAPRRGCWGARAGRGSQHSRRRTPGRQAPRTASRKSRPEGGASEVLALTHLIRHVLSSVRAGPSLRAHLCRVLGEPTGTPDKSPIPYAAFPQGRTAKALGQAVRGPVQGSLLHLGGRGHGSSHPTAQSGEVASGQ